MTKMKKYLLYLALVLIVILGFALSWLRAAYWNEAENNYSLTDLGVYPPTSSDCSSIKNSDNSYPVTLTFNAPDVSAMRDKIKTLAEKYKGQISTDSFYSYPSGSYSQDSVNLIILFPDSQQKFLDELSTLVKSEGGTNSGYTYQNGNQQQYGYSPYTSCLTMLQTMAVDQKQLEVLTDALRRSHKLQTISLLSQSISTARTTLQTDINNLNDFFRTADNPTVNITVSSIPK